MAKGRHAHFISLPWLKLILIPKRQKPCILNTNYTAINKKNPLSLHRQSIKPWLLEDRKHPYPLPFSPCPPDPPPFLRINLGPRRRKSPLPFSLNVSLSTHPFSPGLAIPQSASHPPPLPTAFAELLSPGRSPPSSSHSLSTSVARNCGYKDEQPGFSLSWGRNWNWKLPTLMHSGMIKMPW